MCPFKVKFKGFTLSLCLTNLNKSKFSKMIAAFFHCICCMRTILAGLKTPELG